jgi:hypothetical protein
MTILELGISYGYCHCGCGRKTRLAGRTSASMGTVKGMPNLFIVGHSMQGKIQSLAVRKKKSESLTQHGHAGVVFFGMSKTYRAWNSMIQRCNPSYKQAKDYFGRGITVCERWKKSFEAFLSDMGVKPSGLTLDRINDNGNYEPKNCRWATRKQQSENRRNCVMVEWEGKLVPLSIVATQTHVPYSTVYTRFVYRKMTLADAINRVPRRRRRHAANL